MRDRPAKVLALERCDVRGRRREQGLEALEALHIGAEPIGEGERHGGEQPLNLQIAFVGEVPARRLVNRLDRAFVAVALAERRPAGDPVEHPDQAAALLELCLDVLPFRRLLGEARQEPRAAGLGKARRAHELEPGLRGGGFLVGVDQTEHGRGWAGEAQLVGEQIADQPRAFPRRPALRHVADGEMPHVETIRIDRADFGHAVVVDARGPKALSPEFDPVLVDNQFDIAPDCLGRDRVVRIVGNRIVLRRGGRRSEIVEQRDEVVRLVFDDAEVQALEHRDQPFAGVDQLLVRNGFTRRHPERNHHLVRAGVERGVAGTRLPDHRVELLRPVPGDRFIDPALLVARGKPRRDDPADPGRGEVEDLQTGARGQAFGKERSEDLAGTFVGTDQRGHSEHETLRARIDVKSARGIVDPVG